MTYTYRIPFKGILHELPSTDSQREKVYSAERATFSRETVAKLKTRRGIEGKMNRIAQSPTVRKIRAEFGLGPIRGRIQVETRRAHSRSTSYGGLVAVSKTSFDMWTLLHELAHEILPRGVHHHWPFAYAYLKLVSRYMGADAAKRLKAAFKETGARFKPKRTRNLTEEQRQALRERLAQARAAKDNRLTVAVVAEVSEQDVPKSPEIFQPTFVI